ncbi:MAG: NAD(P)-dependent oxidoreductase [Propionibacteriaceae bacterium]|nr:NAD(P)-dependent oxidoreductase [Propionibacteriaceae bacterium]
MRIVVIGGAGRVASLVVPPLSREHDVLVADRRRAEWWTGEHTQIDILDHQSLPALFEGAEALVYMAMGPLEDWGSTDWARQHFDVNVTGLYLATQAAGQAGVRRIVHTSSGSVFSDWTHRDPGARPDAGDPYGLSKACGEVVAQAAANQFSIPVVALRLFLPTPDDDYVVMADPRSGIATAGSDVAAAYLAALSTDLAPGFYTPHISGNRDGTISIGSARELLGWEPRIP